MVGVNQAVFFRYGLICTMYLPTDCTVNTQRSIPLRFIL